MLGIVLALGSSVAWGTSDFLGGLRARRMSALTVLLVSQPVGLVLSLIVALIVGGDSLSARDTLIAAGAGASVVMALGAFYKAMALGSVTVVATIGALGVLVPVLGGLAQGDRPGAIQVAGAVAGIVGVVLVAVLIWMDFQSVVRTLASLVPLTVGLIWMVGAMVLAQIPMNFINIFVTTMIIGIGVDYGVHIMHRFREVQDLPRKEFENAIVETGKAVVAASVSTIFGFGSIMFSHYPGLVSTGKVAILGAVTTCLVAITLVPAVLTWRYEGRRKKGIPVERAAA